MSARTIQALLLLTLAIVGLWTPVRADIQDGLDDMFMVTGQEPAVYESQRRGGVTMGTFRVRSPINSINLVNLTAPEIRAGCGGIDLYGGSFTFINTDQFRQILRQIGANALGYAFKLALATMCQECDKILTGLQDMMNQFTRMNVDSCRWAQGMVNDTVKAMGLGAETKGMSDASAVGDAAEWMDAAIESFGEPGKWLKNGDADGADPTKPDFRQPHLECAAHRERAGSVRLCGGQPEPPRGPDEYRRQRDHQGAKRRRSSGRKRGEREQHVDAEVELQRTEAGQDPSGGGGQ